MSLNISMRQVRIQITAPFQEPWAPDLSKLALQPFSKISNNPTVEGKIFYHTLKLLSSLQSMEAER